MLGDIGPGQAAGIARNGRRVMAGDWIKMRCDLEDDPAVIGIAADTGIDEYGVVGRLHKVWSWANKHTRDGHAPSVTSSWLDQYIGVQGFANAMQKHGWLLVSERGLEIPKFDVHNGKPGKDRALALNRKRGQREECHDVRVTNSGPEKRREEKSKEIPLPPLNFDLSAEGLAGEWCFSCTRRVKGGYPRDDPEEKAPEFAEMLRLGHRPETIQKAMRIPSRNHSEQLFKFVERHGFDKACAVIPDSDYDRKVLEERKREEELRANSVRGIKPCKPMES
jgi:hypothetical protein